MALRLLPSVELPLTASTADVLAWPNIIPFPRPVAEAGAEVSQRIHLSPPELAGGEFEAVEGTLRSGWIAPAGPVPRAFEAALAEASGFGEVLATSSGTAALHLGYRVLGLGPGDGIWAPTLTFVATVAPAIQMGAKVTFLDVSPETWTLDPDLLRDALAKAAREGRLPRVVVPVDLYGQCADLDGIVAACDHWGVPVLSDSAESLGASGRGGVKAGHGARLACFSFNGNKIITAGGGGALVSGDGALIAAARHLSTQAKEAAPHYQHETTGYSYGLSSVLAAVGLAQLRTLEARVASRRAVFARYVVGLADLPGISFMPEPAWGRSSRWLTVAMFDPLRFGADREAVRRALDAAGIESRPVWKPLHLQPAFRDSEVVGGHVAASLFERGLCLPSGNMTPAVQARVIDTIRRLARH